MYKYMTSEVPREEEFNFYVTSDVSLAVFSLSLSGSDL